MPRGNRLADQRPNGRDQHEGAGAPRQLRAEAVQHTAGGVRAAGAVPLAGHSVRPAAQSQALVQAEVGPRDLPPHVQVAAGARDAAHE